MNATQAASIRRTIREIAGADSHVNVEIIDGAAPPEVVGRSYYWTTPGGTIVRHPQAFARRGWKTVYNHSTRRVVVGIEYAKLITSLPLTTGRI